LGLGSNISKHSAGDCHLWMQIMCTLSRCDIHRRLGNQRTEFRRKKYDMTAAGFQKQLKDMDLLAEIHGLGD
jgi:hypothetical protein